MARKSPRTPRPSEIVMDELTAEGMPWDLNEHLNGCLAGYQEAPSYGAAVSAGTAANGPTIAVAKLGIEGITLAAKRRHALRSASLSLSSNAVCSDVSSAKTISDEERRSWHRPFHPSGTDLLL
jgi:hypothetical protein